MAGYMKRICNKVIVSLVTVMGFIGTAFGAEVAGLRMKPLLDGVATTPVSIIDAKIAFKNEIREVCTLNGANMANGFGTTEECLNKVELQAHPTCSDQLSVPAGNEYRTQDDLKAASRDYLRCAFKIVDVMKKQ